LSVDLVSVFLLSRQQCVSARLAIPFGGFGDRNLSCIQKGGSQAETSKTEIFNLHSNGRHTGDSKMSEKKVIRRNVAIAVVIICIALAVGLIGAVIFYTSQISSLNSKVSDLTDTVNLTKSVLWVNDTTVSQNANNYTSWSFSPISPAGYVVVFVLSSTSNTTYVRVSYSNGISYDNSVTVGTDGQAVFPVVCPPTVIYRSSGYIQTFPFSTIEVTVGNTNTVGNATETVTIFYDY